MVLAGTRRRVVAAAIVVAVCVGSWFGVASLFAVSGDVSDVPEAPCDSTKPEDCAPPRLSGRPSSEATRTLRAVKADVAPATAPAAPAPKPAPEKREPLPLRFDGIPLEERI